MRLYAIFLILNIQLGLIFASPPSSPSQTNHNQKGYECGNDFFTDSQVKDTLSLALAYIDRGYQYPKLYRGKLYSESKFEEYFLFPIKRGTQYLPYHKQASTVYYIVVTRNSIEEVDVVAKITSGKYTKCIRKDSAPIGPSNSVPEISNGYLCAEKFFSDETIHTSLTLAQTNVEENPKYPSPYIGRLYPRHSGLLIWPIMRAQDLYRTGTANIRPYYLILNNERQFIDVVVRGYGQNFLRCIRSRKIPKAPTSDPHSKLFVPPPKFGYLCGKTFFDDEVLRENAQIAKSRASKEIRGKYPERYFGPPFFKECLIWPIRHDGSLFTMGNTGPYRLILTTGYSVMSVAILVNREFKTCGRKKIIPKKIHDTSSYNCNEQNITNQQLVAAADEACAKMNDKKGNGFPAKYKGPGFKSDAPYFTYPVFGDNRKFSFYSGSYRVVINTNCDVVGALTTLKTLDINNRLTKRLVKCHRSEDGPLPPDFFGANAVTAFEYKIRI